VKEAALLLAAGVALAALSALAGGGVETAQLLAALEAQVPVQAWDAERARDRLDDDLLVVDGRDAGAGPGPRGAVRVPFGDRARADVALPAERQVRAALVVMEAGREADARALAEWVARQWALPEVATLQGGIEAWRAAGLPLEEETK